ncbi:MAG TPA: hypothetical protein VF493_09065, partial [Terriglobales bacterium]
VGSCTNVSGLMLEAHAPDHHGNPRAPELITGHASKGYWGHQFSDALERPFIHLFLFSRRPWWAKGL